MLGHHRAKLPHDPRRGLRGITCLLCLGSDPGDTTDAHKVANTRRHLRVLSGTALPVNFLLGYEALRPRRSFDHLKPIVSINDAVRRQPIVSLESQGGSAGQPAEVLISTAQVVAAIGQLYLPHANIHRLVAEA